MIRHLASIPEVVDDIAAALPVCVMSALGVRRVPGT